MRKRELDDTDRLRHELPGCSFQDVHEAVSIDQGDPNTDSLDPKPYISLYNLYIEYNPYIHFKKTPCGKPPFGAFFPEAQGSSGMGMYMSYSLNSLKGIL